MKEKIYIHIEEINFNEILNKIPIFIECMHSSKESNLYKLTFASDLNKKTILASQVYVLKLFKILSINNNYQKEYLINSILDKYLNSYESQIFIGDYKNIDNINFKTKIKYFLFNNFKKYKKESLRADTRQAISSFLEHNYNCNNLLEIIYPYDDDYYLNQLKQFSQFNNLNEGWHIMSHLSHCLFEISLKQYSLLKNKKLQIYIKNIDKLFQNFIETNYQEYIVDQISDSTKIKHLVNSLMKLFTGYKRINYLPFLDYKKILKIILKYNNQSNACDYFNTIFVIDFCLENIENFNLKNIYKYVDNIILKIINDYYFDDIGGFSFYKRSCQIAIYKTYVAKKSIEPDMHGTLMFVWFLSIYGKIRQNNVLKKLIIINP